jgi:hypothetical protein
MKNFIERTPWDTWIIRHDPLKWVCWFIIIVAVLWFGPRIWRVICW